MKQVKQIDIRNSKFSKNEKEFLLTKILNPNSKYILLEKENQEEFLEIREWNLNDVDARLSELGYYAVKKVARELFYKGLDYYHKSVFKVYNTDSPYNDIFDRLTVKDFSKFNKEKCLIRDKILKKTEIIIILTTEYTLDIDIFNAAKDYYINKFETKEQEYSYDDLDVKIY